MDMCHKLLTDMNGCNRKMKEAAIACYARDMVDEMWELTSNPIAIGEDGHIADGQNRLAAAIRANTPLKTMLLLGVTKEGKMCIDQNTPRNVRDVILISGSDKNYKMAPVAKRIHFGGKGFSIKSSNQKALQLMEVYADVISWLQKNIPNVQGVTTTKVFWGAVGRVYIAVRHKSRLVGKLKMFLSILEDGQYIDKDDDSMQNAWKLREVLAHQKRYGGQQVIVYRLVQYALLQTLAGKTIKRWPATERMEAEYFPFAEEVEAEIAEAEEATQIESVARRAG